MTDYVGDVTCICGNIVKDVITGGFYKKCDRCGALIEIQTDGENIWPSAIIEGTPDGKPEFVPGTIYTAKLTE